MQRYKIQKKTENPAERKIRRLRMAWNRQLKKTSVNPMIKRAFPVLIFKSAKSNKKGIKANPAMMA